MAPKPDPPYARDDLPLNKIKLPPNFKISLYVNATLEARFFAVGNRGKANPSIVYVSSTTGKVYAIVDRDGTVQACTLLSDLSVPNPAYDPDTGALYVVEQRRLVRYDGADAAALAGCKADLLASRQIAGSDVLPFQKSHKSRSLGLGPDGKLYYSVAAPFNVDVCVDPYCTIWRINKDGSNPEIFARGIRNAAWLAFHPGTKALVFSGMERDLMGDDLPDDLLGVIYPEQAGINLTWPYCHWTGSGPPELRSPGPGAALPDPDMTPPSFQIRPDDSVLTKYCEEVAAPPLQALGPHVAPLGVLYWPPTTDAPPAGVQRWPAQYDNGFFNAQHGSWNREKPLGYRLAHVKLSEDGRSAVGYSLFAEGWLQPDGTAWGRPSGLARLPDGSMLLGDDRAHVVYRVSYEAPRPRPPPPTPRLTKGTFTLTLVGRQNCPIRGFATGKACTSDAGLTLTRTIDATQRQRWTIAPASGAGSSILGVPVTLRNVGRQSCRPASSFASSAASCAAAGVVLAGTGAPRGSQWTLQQGTGGAYFLASRACPGKYLGAPTTCGVTSLGLYSKGTNVALLWKLTKL